MPDFRKIFYLDYVFIWQNANSRCGGITRHAFKVTMYSHLRLLRAMWKYSLSSSVSHPIQVSLPPIRRVSPNSPSVDLLTQHFEDLKGSPYDRCPLLYVICWTDGGCLYWFHFAWRKPLDQHRPAMRMFSGLCPVLSPLAVRDCWAVEMQLKCGGTDV